MRFIRCDFKKTSSTAIWVVLLIFLYLNYFIAEIQQAPPASLAGHSEVSMKSPVDAIVYISLGKVSKNSLVDYSVATLRNVGQWTGEVYVLTDQNSCFRDLEQNHKVNVIEVPSVKSTMEIKSLKAMIFQHLPEKVKSALYVDIDIVIAKQMHPFLNELGTQLANAKMSNKEIDMGAFYDAKGHYVGWCSGCEKWHTGVLLLFRDTGKACLETWKDTILSGRYTTDQESLDDAEIKGSCKSILAFGSSHLLFAKDYIAMALTSGSTFWHVTAVNRIESQDSFYTNLVVPYLRYSLHDKVDSALLDNTKSCSSVEGGSSVLDRN